MLTGRPPFRAESREATLLQVQQSEPISPRTLNSTVPGDLETICLKCLEKEPSRRYSSAQALAEDLGRFLRGEPIHARPVGRAERLGRWCRRNPVVAGLVVAIAIALLAGTAVSSWFAVSATRSAREAIAQRDRADENAEHAEVSARKGRSLYRHP